MRDGFDRIINAINFVIKDMLRDGWRTVITILNLLVFICCFFCLAALSQAAKQYGHSEENQNSLMVLSKNVFDPGDSLITEVDFTPILELEPSIVEDVSPMIFRILKVEKFFIQVRGVPSDDFEGVFDLSIVEGRFPATVSEAVIGQGTATLTNWKVGQVIRVFGRDFTLTGVVSAPGSKSSSVWMTLPAAESLFNTSGVYQFAWVKVATGVDSNNVRQVLSADTRISNKFDVFFVDHIYNQYANGLNDLGTVSSLLVVLSLLVIMFGAYGSIFLTLSERAREITILRVVGFSTTTIQEILALRSLIQLVTAFLLSWGVSAILLDWISIRNPLNVRTFPLEVVITGKILFAGLGLVLLFGMAGVYLPTFHLRTSSVQSAISR